MQVDGFKPSEPKESFSRYINREVEDRFGTRYKAYKWAKDECGAPESLQTILNFLAGSQNKDNIIPGKISTLCSLVRAFANKTPTQLTDEDIVREVFAHFIDLSGKGELK